MLEIILFNLEVFGIISFALSGIIEARRERLDFVGTYFVALITAFGGGTLRDVLIPRYPIFWIKHDWYLLAIALLALIACVRRSESFPRWIVSAADIFDAAGVGLFSVVGTGYALAAGHGAVAAVVLGVITAIFGGVFRDVICNRLPYVFQHTEACATCALLGSVLYVVLLRVSGTPAETALVVGALVGGSFRFIAVRRKILLPL